MDGAAASKLAAQELKINLAALRKSDKFVLDILETSAQVALYKFDPVKQEWEKTEVEGSLFLYRRSTLPKFALMIMNRLNRENRNEYITKEMEFKVSKPFLLFKNSSMDILGIWFNNPENCEKVGEQIARLYATPPPQPKVEAKENGQSIMQLFANAQRRYDEENKVFENGAVESSSLSQQQNIHTQGDKPRSMSLTTVPPTRSFPAFLPAAVENEETQSHVLHDPCIVKSSPLRPSSGQQSRSLPNSTKKTTPRQLFTQEIPISLPNHSTGEKVPFPSILPQNASTSTKTATSKPVVAKQRSSTDLNTAVTPLMSPMAFKSTRGQSINNAPKDTYVETPLLTKEQLQETLITLLERDSDFVDKIHSAYLKNSSK